MATTYTWRVNNLLVSQTPEPNTAVISNFTLVGSDGVKSGQVTYSVNLLPASASNFTPYNQITQSQAIQWTQDALGPDRIASMESEVQSQITEQESPTPQPAPLPWSTN